MNIASDSTQNLHIDYFEYIIVGMNVVGTGCSSRILKLVLDIQQFPLAKLYVEKVGMKVYLIFISL